MLTKPDDTVNDLLKGYYFLQFNEFVFRLEKVFYKEHSYTSID